MKIFCSYKLAISTMVLAMLTASNCFAFSEDEYNDANHYLLAANAGDKSKIEGAVEKFSALHTAEPKHPLILAKLGTSTAMMSRTTMLPWKKISYAEDGMGMQDKALAMLTASHDTELHTGTPVSLLVRFDVASTFLNVPTMFNRRIEGEKLLNAVLKSPLFEKTSAMFKAHVWMRAGKFAEDQKRVSDARSFYILVQQSGTTLSQNATKQLAALQ